MKPGTKPAADRRELFANANFRWLLGGGVISMLGDQFTLVALPWLVLRLTGDSLALGTVLAVMSLPRAVFILVGGAVADRHSPRRVLMLSKLVNMALLGLLALGLGLGTVPMAAVYALALLLGLSTAFGFPAGSAVLPRCMPAGLLQGANGALMSARQLSMLLGPLMAGGLIALYGDASNTGLAVAFGLDAASFAISAWTLGFVRLKEAEAQPAGTPLLRTIADALLSMWNDRLLRTLCLYVAAVSVFVGGPLQVALPVLARTQLPGGAAALGALLTGHGLGMLAGMVLGGLKKHWRLGTLGGTILLIDALAGLAFLPFGHVHSLWLGLALLAPLGALGGFVQVALMTWIQQRVPPAMLGRAMSLFMFIVMGLAPLASAAAGAALRVLTPAALFTACGVTLLVIVTLGALLTPIRAIRDAGAS
jgi:MFS family permease